MSNETAIAIKKDISTAEMIRRGANLAPEEWDDVRIAAARKLLPQRFQTAEDTIAYLARAREAGLNPFTKELWAWESRGDLIFMTSRDALIRKARDDDAVEGIEFGHIHEKDNFKYEQTEGHVTVQHNVGFPRGRLLGAFCAVHMVPPESDAIVTAEMDDYSHLQKKDNWRNYGRDMILTRAISSAVKLKVPTTAGLYTEADMELTEDAGHRDRAQVSAATDRKADALAAELSEEKSAPIEAEATEEPEGRSWEELEEEAAPEVDGEGKGEAESGSTTESASEASSQPSSETTPSTEEPEAEEVELKPCPICTEPQKPSGMGGHVGGHSRAGYKLPAEGYHVMATETEENGTMYEAVSPDGELIQNARTGMTEHSSWERALETAHEHHDEEPAPAADEPAEDEDTEAFADAYKALFDALETVGRPGDIGYVRSEAEKLFPNAVDPETGQVKLTNLTPGHLGDLREEILEGGNDG